VNGDFDEYTRLIEAIIGEGNFSKENIRAAVKSEIDDMTEDEDTTETSASKEVSIYEVEYVYNEIVDGDTVMAQAMKEDIIRTHEANGKDRYEAEESFNSSFTSYVKKRYAVGDLTEYDAQNMLVNFCGKDSDEAASKIQYWEFQKNYPDYDDLTESAVAKYYEYAQPSGIGVGVYYDYCKQRSNAKGTDNNGDGKTDSGSVKSQVLYIINSLPLTYAQKDALYYLNGWAASTIWQAPWH
jgi:hypothetical protein